MEAGRGVGHGAGDRASPGEAGRKDIIWPWLPYKTVNLTLTVLLDSQSGLDCLICAIHRRRRSGSGKKSGTRIGKKSRSSLDCLICALLL